MFRVDEHFTTWAPVTKIPNPDQFVIAAMNGNMEDTIGPLRASSFDWNMPTHVRIKFTPPVTVTRKRGMNRGRPRIWLEGKILTEAGFSRGDQILIEQTDTGLIITRDVGGRNKVSGKAEKPIIDIMGATLGVLAEVEQVSVTYDHGCLYLKIEEAT